LATRQRKKSRLREPRFLMAAICILALVLPDPADVRAVPDPADVSDPADVRTVGPSRPGGCSCHAVGLDLQSRPIEYKDFQSAGQQ
jgi:hypothetical protein